MYPPIVSSRDAHATECGSQCQEATPQLTEWLRGLFSRAASVSASGFFFPFPPRDSQPSGLSDQKSRGPPTNQTTLLNLGQGRIADCELDFISCPGEHHRGFWVTSVKNIKNPESQWIDSCPKTPSIQCPFVRYVAMCSPVQSRAV